MKAVEPGRLVLLLLLLPTLAQFQLAGGRINGDGLMYYSYVRSLWKDFDADLASEYAHFGLAVVWSPFFLAGEAIGRAWNALGGATDMSGYGPVHVGAVCLGSLLYGFLAVVLVHDLLLRHFGPGTALGAALLVWGATFLHWYMVEQPAYPHATAACAAALALWLWDRSRGRRDARGTLLLGLVLGLAWLLRQPPQGARLGDPHVLQTLFSSRHGLLSWTPLLWAGYLGFLPLLRRKPALAWPLVPPLLLLTYLNMCAGDWWAGGSFSNRRFDSLLPILALGIAASLDVAREALRRRPALALLGLAVPLVTWNVLLAEQLRRGQLPRDATVEFPSLAGNAASLFADALGSPPTWPASPLFAWRHGVPASRYDLLVGRYLFDRENRAGGRISLGAPRDEPLLAEGWGPIENVDGRSGRAVRGRGRLFAPLDVPEGLLLRVSAQSPDAGREVRVLVNGKEAGRFRAGPVWSTHAVPAAAAFWRRELNDVVFDAAGAELRLAEVGFERLGAS